MKMVVIARNGNERVIARLDRMLFKPAVLKQRRICGIWFTTDSKWILHIGSNCTMQSAIDDAIQRLKAEHDEKEQFKDWMKRS